MPSFKILIKTAVVLLIIHFLFSSYRLIPVLNNFHPLTFINPMGELILVYLIMNGKKAGYLRIFASLLILAFLVFFLSGELFYRIFYLERFDMISDMQLIPNFLVMLMPEDILPPVLIKVAAVIITIAATFLIALLFLRIINKHKIKDYLRLSRNTVLILALGAVLIMIIFPASSPLMQTVGLYGHSAVRANGFQQTTSSRRSGGDGSLFEELSTIAMKVKESELDSIGISELDLHFAVIESYGAVLFQKPEYADYITEVYKKLQPLLNDDGWSVRSGYVNSPAFGGRSWLADATLLAGEQVQTQRNFDERLKTGDPAYFLTLMKKAGYQSYYIAPGSTQASEEWKAAYPFDHYLLRSDFDYEGPFVSFGTMTDQYVYDFFSSRMMKEDQKEFAFYLMVSSHTPFERIPIYKEDWDFSRKGREYQDGYIKYFENNWLYGNELAEGYLEGISYSLETTVQYLTKILTDKQFMLIIGDHQPRKPVSGPDPGYPVPFHIIVPAVCRIQIPAGWNLSYGMFPPDLPVNYDEIPDMAEIPHLIEQLLR